MSKWKPSLPLLHNITILNGGTPSTKESKFWNGDIPWLSVEDFNTGYRYVFTASKQITELGLKHSSTRLLSPGMLIISARGTVGALAQIANPMAFNQSCYGIDSNTLWTNDFLYYYLTYKRRDIESITQGNVFSTITKETFKDIKVPVLPPYEQAKIAEVLTAMDAVIEKTKAIIAKYRKIKEGMLQDLLTNGIDEHGQIRSPKTHKYKPSKLGMIPVEWEIISLRGACRQKGKYGINAAATDFSQDVPLYLRITDITDDGRYSLTNRKCVLAPNYQDYVLQTGDIVFARTGATTGKTYLYDNRDGTLVFAGFLIKFTPDTSILNSYFLKQYTTTQEYMKWVSCMSLRSGQPGINGNEYGKLLLRCPTIEEQNKTASILQEIDAKIQAEQTVLAKFELQKQGLMQDLLTNRVSVEPLLKQKGAAV